MAGSGFVFLLCDLLDLWFLTSLGLLTGFAFFPGLIGGIVFCMSLHCFHFGEQVLGGGDMTNSDQFFFRGGGLGVGLVLSLFF